MSPASPYGSPAQPLDLMDKVARARRLRGPKLFIALATCPPGWGVDPSASVEMARLAVDCGIWPLKEWQGGEVTHTVVPNHFRPVEEYLEKQGRYRHLFEPEHQSAILARIQGDVDRYWAAL